MTQATLISVFGQLPLPEEILRAMPIYPGKIMLILLVLLSIAVWAIIFSKSFRLDQVVKADLAFRRRLRKSRTCLEVFEEGVDYPNSPLFMVYREAARTTAKEMIGSTNPAFLREKRLFTAQSLDPGQLQSVVLAFERGQQAALERLSKGFRSLSILAMAAAILGLISACIFMVQALNTFSTDFQRTLVFCLIVLFASFMVSVPAGWFRFRLARKFRGRMTKLIQFREAVEAVFHDQLLKSDLEETPSKEPVSASEKKATDAEKEAVPEF